MNMNCIYCSHELNVKGYFCGSCKKQVRCSKCNNDLEKDELGCIWCGSDLGVTASAKSTTDSHVNKPMNQINFEQKGNAKTMRASFSDEVGAAFAGFFSEVMLNKTVRPQAANNRWSLSSNQGELRKTTLGLPAKNIAPNIQDAEVIPPNSPEEFEQILHNIFRVEGEKIILINSRLKQTGKLDHAIRITLLYIYTHKLLDRHVVERSALMEVLEKSKLVNRHLHTWLVNCDELIRKDKSFELSVPREDTALAILQELVDPNVEKGSIKFSKTGGKGRAGKRKNSTTSSTGTEDSGKATSKRTRSPLDSLNLLIQEGFFNERKRVKEILENLATKKATHFKGNEISPTLSRLIKDKKLNREKNSTDNQYEYYVG